MSIFSRFARYFDEVASAGSIRRASERLNIASSAIDRQILQMEEHLNVRLFERFPHGVRLTAAGEVLIEAVRRWRRDYVRVISHIDALQGLRRGEVEIVIAEGATDILSRYLKAFQDQYPGISYRISVVGSIAAVEQILNGSAEIGLIFNPPASPRLRVEQTLIYQLGAVLRPDHPLADRTHVALADCADFPMIVPDDSISLRPILDQTWSRSLGGIRQFSISSNSMHLLKKLAMQGMGIAMLTQADVSDELASGELRFIPLTISGIELSVLSLISAFGRTLSVPASLLLQHIGKSMTEEGTATGPAPGLML